MKPTLLVLAAGMGSRYGGLKQIDAFGPNGETIIDYSIYDAIRAGFGKVVFVVRSHFKEKFADIFNEKLKGKIEVDYVVQELDKIPDNLDYSKERTRPWGTAHAVLMGAEVIDGNFAVINGDDFYGPEAYKCLNDFFQEDHGEDVFAVVAYYLNKTLSDFGAVNRGICYGNGDNLEKIVETLKISRNKESQVIEYPNQNDGFSSLEEDTLVSMNLFGFKPNFFKHTIEYFKEFLKANSTELNAEFFIPLVLDKMIKDQKAEIRLLNSDAEWFGVTYKEDKDFVKQKLQALIDNGVYPSNLWSN